MPNQTDTFARLDTQRKVLKERLAMRTIAERDAIEMDLTFADADGPSLRPIFHAQRQHAHLHQLFHFVYAALQIRYMLPDITQIAMDDEITGQHKRDSAWSG